jgi:hypothetical protein
MNKPNSNAALKHPVITIRVISVDRNVVTYENFFAPGGRPFKFSATIGIDRATIALLEPGKGYAIHQSVDVTNTTHWTSAVPFLGGHRPTADAITARVAKVKSKVEVKKDFLDDVMEW